eukprot:42178-Rhodomonas_salina.3
MTAKKLQSPQKDSHTSPLQSKPDRTGQHNKSDSFVQHCATCRSKVEKLGLRWDSVLELKEETWSAPAGPAPSHPRGRNSPGPSGEQGKLSGEHRRGQGRRWTTQIQGLDPVQQLVSAHTTQESLDGNEFCRGDGQLDPSVELDGSDGSICGGRCVRWIHVWREMDLHVQPPS